MNDQQLVLAIRERINHLKNQITHFESALAGLNGVATTTAPAAAPTSKGVVRKSGRRPMTAAQRKAVGERMRKFWAAKRKAAK